MLLLGASFGVSAGLDAADNQDIMAEIAMLALESSPRYQAKQLELKIQDENIVESRSGFYPHISLGAGIGREDSRNSATRSDPATDSQELERREASINLRQMLFDGFRTVWGSEVEKTERKIVELELAALAEQTVAEAIKLWIDVIISESILGLSQGSLKKHQQIYEDVRKRVDAGRDGESELNQARARLALASANQEQAYSELLVVRQLFRERVGSVPVATLQDLAENVLLQLPAGDNETELRNDAVNNNFRAQAALIAVDAARLKSKSERSSFWPSIYIDAGASRNENLDGVRGDNDDTFAMLRVDYRLYSGGSKRALNRKRYLEIQHAQLNVDAIQQDLNNELGAALMREQKFKARLNYLDDYVAATRLTQTAYDKQFQIGRRGLLELLDAENEKVLAEREAIEALRELYFLRVDVLSLRGVLLDEIRVEITQ